MNTLICLVRNYRECIPKLLNFEWDKEKVTRESLAYLDILKKYDEFSGPKILLYYKDLIQRPRKLLFDLSYFLIEHAHISHSIHPSVEQHVMLLCGNQKNLFHICSKGKKRYWGGYNSKGKLNSHQYPWLFLNVPDNRCVQ